MIYFFSCKVNFIPASPSIFSVLISCGHIILQISPSLQGCEVQAPETADRICLSDTLCSLSSTGSPTSTARFVFSWDKTFTFDLICAFSHDFGFSERPPQSHVIWRSPPDFLSWPSELHSEMANSKRSHLSHQLSQDQGLLKCSELFLPLPFKIFNLLLFGCFKLRKPSYVASSAQNAACCWSTESVGSE